MRLDDTIAIDSRGKAGFLTAVSEVPIGQYDRKLTPVIGLLSTSINGCDVFTQCSMFGLSWLGEDVRYQRHENNGESQRDDDREPVD
jgi:hypothetical protein